MRVELEPWLSAYKRMVPGGRECWPSRCLAPDALAMDRLLFSNSRIDLSEGRTFAQVSLSPYFQGLKIVQRGASCHTQSDAGRAPIYLPVRRFQGDCLRTRKGASVLKRLLESCSLVIIQDADLRPSDLAAHWQLLKPNRFRGIDLTKFLGLRGHYCYALLHFNDEGAKSWKGVKLF